MKRQGFTVVELLIVIVVVGILAAITIVAYSGIQRRAGENSVQADLRNIGQSIEVYATLNDGIYPAGADADAVRAVLATISIKPSKGAYLTNGSSGNFLYINNNSGADFALVAKTKAGNSFYYSSRTKSVQGYSRDFVHYGAADTRVQLLGAASNPSPAVWGYGSSGWADAWIK